MTTRRYISLTLNAEGTDAARTALDRLHTVAGELFAADSIEGVSLSVTVETDEPDEVSEAATALDDLVTGLMLGGDSTPPGDVIAQAQQRLRAALARQ